MFVLKNIRAHRIAMYSIENFRAFNVRCFSDPRTFFNSELLSYILIISLYLMDGPGDLFTNPPTPTADFSAGVIGMRVSPGCVFPHTHIPRDACFPAHISLGMRVSHQ